MTTLTAIPTFPPIGSASFNLDAYTWAVFMAGTHSTEINLIQAEFSANATTATTKAAEAAISAAGALASEIAAGVSAGAAKWVSGTTYSLGAAVWSPVDRTIYRRIVAGAGTTDPSSDTTNWASIHDSTTVKLTYALDYALTQAANANKRIDVAQNYMVQTGTAQVTQTAVARDAVSQAAACWLVRANPTVTVTLPKAYPDTDYQVIVEVESAAPTSATTAAAQYAAYAGEVEVTSRATNSFVITLTGSATTTNLRWKTLHPAATRNKTAFQEAYTYIYGTGHNPMTGVAI
jgi:hypothetical protein